MNKESNAEYWISLSQVFGYNNHKIKRLCELYEDITVFIAGGEREWKHCGILNLADLHKLKTTDYRETETIMEKCKKYGYSILCIDDEDYPECLFNIYAPPAVLYIEGSLPDVDHVLTIGIVGTRTASNYGVRNSYQFGYALSKYGVYTVSGGALGVDCASHRGTLAANGVTICVLGCGINYNYLKENAGMRKAITRDGAVISEYPPDTPPKAYHFPARNRLIAALSQGVLIIESGKRSGSLITADLALEQGKELFALMGNNSPNNEGSNERIKEGTATPVTDFMDIILAFRGKYFKEEQEPLNIVALADIEEIPVKNGKRTRKRLKGFKKVDPGYTIDDILDNSEDEEPAPQDQEPEKPAPVHRTDVELTDAEKRVYERLSAKSVHIDTIVKETGLPVFTVLSALMKLELKGLTVSKNKRYSLK